jgi:hypothetical protein
LASGYETTPHKKKTLNTGRDHKNTGRDHKKKMLINGSNHKKMTL